MANDTKERILAAALEMFSRYGYAGTNIRELTASLGFVKSSMYKHFKSKDEFEGYPGITMENGGKYLAERLGSAEYYAVELPVSGKVIGNICCGNRDFQAKEVGYIINRDYQRHGYAGEALEAVVFEAFRAGAHRVYAACDPRNTCSWRLLEKLGFRREACFRQNMYFRTDAAGAPKWKDTYVYTLLKDDLAEGGNP